MQDLAGRWYVDEVVLQHGSGRRAPKQSTEIEILKVNGPEGRYYIFTFLPQTGGLREAVSVAVTQPEVLDRLLLLGEAGYWLHAEHKAETLAGSIGFRADGGRGSEDNDTAVFTATKTRPPAEKA
jgi:hypothetical protein